VVRRFLALIILFSFSQLATAQVDCGEALTNARNELDAGHVEPIPAILEGCLNKFTSVQKIDAYRILTITYLYLDNPLKAEASFMALLHVDPEFRVTDDDPIELVYLSKQYITNPIISFSARAGASFSIVSVLNSNRVDRDSNTPPRYRPGVGFVAQGAFDLHFNNIVALNTAIEISSRNYKKEGTLFAGNPEEQDLEQIRNNTHLSLPIALSFTYPGELNSPYIYGGYSPSYTINSKAQNIRRQIRQATTIEGPTVDKIHSTARFSHSLIFGIGLKRRIKYTYVLIDLRYRLGMTNMNNQNNQFDFSNEDVKEDMYTYLNPDDDYTWSGIELTVGFVLPKYRPRKKNSVTIQTVIKNFFSKKRAGR
jgi:Outer membrane protein beta-barrel domain